MQILVKKIQIGWTTTQLVSAPRYKPISHISMQPVSDWRKWAIEISFASYKLPVTKVQKETRKYKPFKTFLGQQD